MPKFNIELICLYDDNKEYMENLLKNTLNKLDLSNTSKETQEQIQKATYTPFRNVKPNKSLFTNALNSIRSVVGATGGTNKYNILGLAIPRSRFIIPGNFDAAVAAVNESLKSYLDSAQANKLDIEGMIAVYAQALAMGDEASSLDIRVIPTHKLSDKNQRVPINEDELDYFLLMNYFFELGKIIADGHIDARIYYPGLQQEVEVKELSCDYKRWLQEKRTYNLNKRSSYGGFYHDPGDAPANKYHVYKTRTPIPNFGTHTRTGFSEACRTKVTESFLRYEKVIERINSCSSIRNDLNDKQLTSFLLKLNNSNLRLSDVELEMIARGYRFAKGDETAKPAISEMPQIKEKAFMIAVRQAKSYLDREFKDIFYQCEPDKLYAEFANSTPISAMIFSDGQLPHSHVDLIKQGIFSEEQLLTKWSEFLLIANKHIEDVINGYNERLSQEKRRQLLGYYEQQYQKIVEFTNLLREQRKVDEASPVKDQVNQYLIFIHEMLQALRAYMHDVYTLGGTLNSLEDVIRNANDVFKKTFPNGHPESNDTNNNPILIYMMLEVRNHFLVNTLGHIKTLNPFITIDNYANNQIEDAIADSIIRCIDTQEISPKDKQVITDVFLQLAVTEHKEIIDSELSPIVHAILANDYEALLTVLNTDDADPNVTVPAHKISGEDDTHSALSLATLQGKVEMTRLLLLYGAYPEDEKAMGHNSELQTVLQCQNSILAANQMLEIETIISAENNENASLPMDSLIEACKLDAEFVAQYLQTKLRLSRHETELPFLKELIELFELVGRTQNITAIEGFIKDYIISEIVMYPEGKKMFANEAQKDDFIRKLGGESLVHSKQAYSALLQGVGSPILTANPTDPDNSDAISPISQNFAL